ncbi:MAG: redoxin domain-containing protein [Rhodospirillaceae bacterium]|nr:redoxin domain-containing protein [Rhodospirillaceae bacterium]
MATMRGTMDSLSDEMIEAMNVTREFLGNRNVEKDKMDARAPKILDQAPDFTAERLSGDGSRTGEKISLSNILDKPVGLLFGSYTCPIFRDQLHRYEEIHQARKAQINFLCIYILEAHPEDGWRVPHNWNKDICLPTPQTLDERAKIAHLCRIKEGFTVPMALDTMENELLALYAGTPERLYAINTNGMITHKSSVGPFTLDDVEAWDAALGNLTDA